MTLSAIPTTPLNTVTSDTEEMISDTHVNNDYPSSSHPSEKSITSQQGRSINII